MYAHTVSTFSPAHSFGFSVSSVFVFCIFMFALKNNSVKAKQTRTKWIISFFDPDQKTTTRQLNYKCERPKYAWMETIWLQWAALSSSPQGDLFRQINWFKVIGCFIVMRAIPLHCSRPEPSRSVLQLGSHPWGSFHSQPWSHHRTRPHLR